MSVIVGGKSSSFSYLGGNCIYLEGIFLPEFPGMKLGLGNTSEEAEEEQGKGKEEEKRMGLPMERRKQGRRKGLSLGYLRWSEGN